MKTFRISHLKKYECFLNVANMFLSSIFFSMKILLLYESFAKLTQFDAIGVHFQTSYINNQNLKSNQMNFYFKFLDIHTREKRLTCHDYYGFK
jgi:hypothetical protein